MIPDNLRFILIRLLILILLSGERATIFDAVFG